MIKEIIFASAVILSFASTGYCDSYSAGEYTSQNGQNYYYDYREQKYYMQNPEDLNYYDEYGNMRRSDYEKEMQNYNNYYNNNSYGSRPHYYE